MNRTTLGLFLEPDRAQGMLTSANLSGPGAREAAPLLTAAAASLRDAGVPTDRPAAAFWVPGRIEVLGKHTDYAGGSSLVAALERGFVLLATSGEPGKVTLRDAEGGRAARFSLSPDIQPRAGTWSSHPMTTVRRLVRDFQITEGGVHMAFASNLPSAAGLSSSSALIVATALGMAHSIGLQEHPLWQAHLPGALTLAAYLGCVENGAPFGPLEGDHGVGTRGGSGDHTAILASRPGRLTQFAYLPTRLLDTFEVPADQTFAIASSGVRASKTGTAREPYNRAADLAATLTRRWNEETGRSDRHLADVLASGPGAPVQLREIVGTATGEEHLAGDLLGRLDHFLLETGEVLPAAIRALSEGDLEAFGRAAATSQRGAEDLLGNQVPETARLTALAAEEGAVAASAFGAGFGGSVWALVRADSAAGFIQRWRARYLEAFPRRRRSARFFVTPAGPPAVRLGV